MMRGNIRRILRSDVMQKGKPEVLDIQIVMQKGLNVMFMWYYCNTGKNFNMEPATECSTNVVES
jgi:hypothetical protein